MAIFRAFKVTQVLFSQRDRNHERDGSFAMQMEQPTNDRPMS
jgi:hypothetical protein